MDGSRLRRRRLLRNVLRRLDAAARDLNLVLVVIAVGLAALDLTFAVSQKTLVRLPVTRVVGDVKGEFHFVDVHIGARLRQARERRLRLEPDGRQMGPEALPVNPRCENN